LWGASLFVISTIDILKVMAIVVIMESASYLQYWQRVVCITELSCGKLYGIALFNISMYPIHPVAHVAIVVRQQQIVRIDCDHLVITHLVMLTHLW
jgi:hypothetical protein